MQQLVYSVCALNTPCMQVRLGKMSDLLDALMEQFPMPPPTLFAANDIDKCVLAAWLSTTTVIQGLNNVARV